MKSLSFTIPNSWNSLSDKQIIKIACLFFTKNNVQVIDYKIFKIFNNLKWYKFRLLKKIILLFKTRTVTEIKKHFAFIYTKQDLTRFVPVVKVGKQKYYAPTNNLSNLTIGEFSVTEDLYLGYLRNQNSEIGISYLKHLFATLYVTASEVKRPEFDKSLLPAMVDKIEKVKPKHLYAMLLSYKGCRDAITENKKYKHIFPDKKKTDSVSESIPESSGFSDVILSFSGKIFGDYHKTYKTNLYTFLDGYELILANLPKQEQ